MDNFRIQYINSDSDGSEHRYTQADATQTDLEKDPLIIREENAELISEIADLCTR
ncbi:hypothetical protein DPMN_137113 [Dreissena polymorpha]|nr:hypothetical protein DPMN_137113 [Dreissena polymorpha]